jgi:hypothetical protein
VMSSRGLAIGCVGGLSGLLVSLLVWSAPALAAGLPVVDGESVSHVGIESAKLSAQVNPEESATTYRFEYGTSEAYGSRMPLSSEAPVGSGGEDVTVSQPLSGLAPGTVYHYRVVASNTEGTTDGTDRTLKIYSLPSGTESCPNASIRDTQFSTYLPDCRAYELVSPVDKEGANVTAMRGGGTRSSFTGDAVKFDSDVGFGDVQGVEGIGYEYASSRGADGWTTHAINPKQDSLALGLYTSSQYVAFSEDLRRGVYIAYKPVLPGHPNVEHATNLYLRSDTLSAPPGSYELLTDSVGPVPPEAALPPVPGGGSVGFADASADLTHVIFQSQNDMTPEAEGLSLERFKLYEWANGSVRLAGILPDGKPAEASVAGRGAGGGEGSGESAHYGHNWSVNTISANGSRVVFEAAPFTFVKTGEGDEAEAFEGNLYMRIDGRETIQLNVSERSTPDPAGPQPAEFFGATGDDSKVLFASNELLTNDASGNRNIYMYDVNAPTGKHLTLISVDSEPNGNDRFGSGSGTNVLYGGISGDGSYVYFEDETALVAGQPRLKTESELYVWHNGVVRAIVEHGPITDGRPRNWGENGPFTHNSEFRVTPDGRHAMFVVGTLQQEMESAAALAGIEVPRPLLPELFVYDYETGKLACASCNPSGAGPEGDTGIQVQADFRPFDSDPSDYLTRALSSDGRHAFFDTENALLPQDTNGKRDVYEYDTQTGEVHLISGGTCGCDSTFVDASADGSSVFFTTHQSLVRADVDSSADMYVARVGGGIPSQNELPRGSCEGDDCQGPARLAPVFSLPASSTFAGVGNTPPSAGGPVSPRSRALSSAQRLKRALRLCRKKPGGKRRVCEARARRRYGAGGASRARVHKSSRVGL